MPDGLFITGVGLTLHLWNKGALSSFLRWAGIQWLLITFTVVSMVQIGPQRRNISRLVLETPFLNVLGYVSYPMCKFKNATMVLRNSIPPDHNSFLFTVDLLQEVCFNFYAQVLYLMMMFALESSQCPVPGSFKSITVITVPLNTSAEARL